MVEKVDILEQVERIKTSKDFQCSARTKSLLMHLVQLELEGRSDELHGSALAMDVFGRGADFDPNNDLVVRTEAAKLRKALRYFCLAEGNSDPVAIYIPKGQYRPLFEANSKMMSPRTHHYRGVKIGLVLGSELSPVRIRYARNGSVRVFPKSWRCNWRVSLISAF